MKDHLYQKLSLQSRTLALFEAIARKDEPEIQRLIDTAPRQTISAPAREFRDQVDDILISELAHECDMRGEWIGFLTSLLIREPNHTWMTFFTRLVHRQQEWETSLTGKNIPPDLIRSCGIDRPAHVQDLFDMLIPFQSTDSRYMNSHHINPPMPDQFNPRVTGQPNRQ